MPHSRLLCKICSGIAYLAKTVIYHNRKIYFGPNEILAFGNFKAYVESVFSRQRQIKASQKHSYGFGSLFQRFEH